ELSVAVQVDFATADGTAHAGTDYQATSGTLLFASGQTTATISVPIIGNTILQSNRTFSVSLSNPIELPSFTAATTFAAGTTGAHGVVVGDINGDGKPDVVLVAFRSYDGAVFLNTPSPGATRPGFAAAQTLAMGSYGYSATPVALADLNGDGRPD